MVFESCFARKDQFMEGKALIENEGIKAKLNVKLDAKHAIGDDEALTKKLNSLIAQYEKVVPGIEKTLESEPAPEDPHAAVAEVAEVAEVAPPTKEEMLEKAVAAFVENQGREPTAQERAAIEGGIKTAEKPVPAGAGAPSAPEAAEEGPPAKLYVLTKYERVEFEDLLKGHQARLEALKAARDAINASVRPKKMTTTPVEEDAMSILGAKKLLGSK